MSKDIEEQVKDFLDSNKKLERKYNELEKKYNKIINNNEISIIQYYDIKNNIIKLSDYNQANRDIKVNNMKIRVIFDSGAALSVMSMRLMKKLSIELEKKEENFTNNVSGDQIKTLGYIRKEVEIKNIKIPITFVIIESSLEEVLLGNDFLEMTKARIDYKTRKIEMHYNNKYFNIDFNI